MFWVFEYLEALTLTRFNFHFFTFEIHLNPKNLSKVVLANFNGIYTNLRKSQ